MSGVTLRCAVLSDVGRRENNEDAVLATDRLAVVADGVGGATAGEIASRLVTGSFQLLQKSRLTGPLEDALRGAVRAASERIGLVTASHPRHEGMATTVTAVAVTDDGRFLVTNVGDSRTYLYRAGELRQLTRDDSLVQELLETGAITPEQARNHPARSIVTAVLDGREVPSLPLVSLAAQAGDRVLLCSDGLSDAVDDELIAELLKTDAADDCAQALVDAALANGGRDNITVIVADVEPRDEDDPGWLPVLAPA